MKRKAKTATIEDLAKVAPVEAMDNTPRVTLTLTRETIWLTRHDDRGAAISTYPVSASDVAGVFHGFSADTGLLPPDVLFWQTRGTQPRIGVYVPPARRTIRFATGKREKSITIPAPGLVFVGSGHSYSVYAAKTRPLAIADQLYHAPFSNVYPDGRICTGNVEVPECTTTGVAKFVQSWWESTFTDHISADRVDDPRPLWKFWQSLCDARKFPVRKLLPLCQMGAVIAGTTIYPNRAIRRDPLPLVTFERERVIDTDNGPIDDADDATDEELNIDG